MGFKPILPLKSIMDDQWFLRVLGVLRGSSSYLVGVSSGLRQAS
jgi:hypothetical protein